MPKKPHVLSSIFIILITILPLIFVLGVLAPILLYNILTPICGDCSIIFTVTEILLLLAILSPPPLNKKKLAFFTGSIKGVLKKFCKPKPNEDVLFKDNIVHFATTEHLTNDSKSQPEIIDEKLEIINNGVITQQSQIIRQNSVVFSEDSRISVNDTFILQKFKVYNSFSDIVFTYFLKNSTFDSFNIVFFDSFFLNFKNFYKTGENDG